MKKNTPASKTGPNCDLLEAYIFACGTHSPTQAQMSTYMGLSVGAVQNLLTHLERAGRIQRGGRAMARSITVITERNEK